MNEPLSVYSLIAGASWPVLAIIIGLMLASLVSWTMIVQRWLALSRALRDLQSFEDFFWSGRNLRDIFGDISNEAEPTGIESVFLAGFSEFERLSEQNADADAIMTGVQRATRVAVTREEMNLELHLGFLATLGSTAPYIGLFGTVIGIINSFRSLVNLSQATLASVAPGISEALIATAIGLFVAIPAVIAFNRFSARVEVLTKGYESFVDELISILFRASQARSP
ncbi:MAG: protein TolQ [Gammaproteobacteria bacterium]|nr:protein TolQ [Gammaproteobacteria bacterium]